MTMRKCEIDANFDVLMNNSLVEMYSNCGSLRMDVQVIEAITIEINGVVHEFFARDTSHPQTEEIYQQLDDVEERLNFVGHVPDSSQAPMVDDLDDEKGHSLRLHIERLANAFGLLNSKQGIPNCIFNNL
ncbi:Pentatricopeptide repeat-containing protein [Abeliophyllum distichum]|uniref:Pentatricopeptide repeat-containing protein n=1 Tax=Abeliophyllum distichum TaxID=126358 RepID=A0ABD1V5Z4_9LAMI